MTFSKEIAKDFVQKRAGFDKSGLLCDSFFGDSVSLWEIP